MSPKLKGISNLPTSPSLIRDGLVGMLDMPFSLGDSLGNFVFECRNYGGSEALNEGNHIHCGFKIIN